MDPTVNVSNEDDKMQNVVGVRGHEDQMCLSVIDEPIPIAYSSDPKHYAERRFGMLVDLPLSMPSANTPVFCLALGYNVPDARSLPYSYNVNNIIRFITEKVLQKDMTSTFVNTLRNFRHNLDIHPSRSLIDLPCWYFGIRRRECQVLKHGETSLATFYFIDFPNEDPDEFNWKLALESASNVVLAIREGWGINRRDMVREMLLQGIPFRTLRLLEDNRTYPVINMSHLHTCPLIPEDEKFGLLHFQQWEQRREAFFEGPFGSIAGRFGGIYSRLWRVKSSRFRQRLESVMEGPTKFAPISGVRIEFDTGEVYYDDAITELMGGVISGTYVREHSSVYAASGQQKKFSWFPLHSAWVRKRERKTLRWTNVDEDLFLERYQGILKHVNDFKSLKWQAFQPMMATKWMQESRAGAHALDLGYEGLAKEFLGLYIEQHSLSH